MAQDVAARVSVWHGAEIREFVAQTHRNIPVNPRCRRAALHLPQRMIQEPRQVILVVLTLIDLTQAANLRLQMFSGDQRFISEHILCEGADRSDRMGNVDFNALKMKLITAILANSAIELLKPFIGNREMSADPVAPQRG